MKCEPENYEIREGTSFEALVVQIARSKKGMQYEKCTCHYTGP